MPRLTVAARPAQGSRDLGGLNSTAWNKGINDRGGQVVGAAETAVVDPHLDQGGITAVPRVPVEQREDVRPRCAGGNDPDSIATGINERGGEVVGLSVADGDTYNGQNVRGFVWAAGRMAALATLGGSHAGPAAINNRGQVVGQSQLPGDAVSHAVLWTHGRANDLGGTVPRRRVERCGRHHRSRPDRRTVLRVDRGGVSGRPVGPWQRGRSEHPDLRLVRVAADRRSGRERARSDRGRRHP